MKTKFLFFLFLLWVSRAGWGTGPGDLNGDGSVSLRDAIIALHIVVGLASVTPKEKPQVDVDGDGRITLRDVLRILRIAIGLERAPEVFSPSDAKGREWYPAEGDLSAPIYSLILERGRPIAWAASPGQGLFKGEEGGRRWMPAGPEVGELPLSLLQDPILQERLYVGTMDRGIYCSSDGGKTWEPCLAVSRPGPIDTLTADPSVPGLIYAAGRYFFRSRDFGRTWEQFDLPEEGFNDVHALATHPRWPGMVILGTRTGNIYLSRDQGETWQKAQDRPMPVRIFSFAVDPFNENWIYAGTCNGSFWKSEDGGFIWRQAGGSSMPPNVNMVLPDPQRPGHLYAATSAGPMESFDYGETWELVGEALLGKEALCLALGNGRETPLVLVGMWLAPHGVYYLQ